MLTNEFKFFSDSLETLLTKGVPGISVDKYKQISLIVGAASTLGYNFDDLNYDAWAKLAGFIREPRKAGQNFLTEGYPEPKGRWAGSKGQKAQCDAVVEVLKKIVNK